MTKQQLLQLKKRIDIILKRLTEEAVENGVNVASAEFEDILLKAKTKLLEERGISLEEYIQMMQEINEDRKENKNKKTMVDELLLMELAEAKGLKGEKGDVGEKGKDGKDAIIDYNKIIKEVVRKIPKPKDGRTIIKEKEIIKEIDKTELEEFKKDILELQKIVSEIKIPEIPKIPDYQQIKKEIQDWSADHINQHPNILNMPNFRLLGMGLQGQIDEKVQGINTKKITVSTTQPSNPNVNDLWVDIS